MCALLCTCNSLHAQQSDSLRLTLQEAEKIFLERNLWLLAQQYEIDIATANELQQRLFNNPNFSSEISLYGGGNNKWFDNGRNGQKAWAVEQLITLAGKRNKQVRLAKEQTREAGIQFFELVRTLKFELSQQFYNLAYANELLVQLDEQAQLLGKIINAYDDQSVKRNVSLKDAVRLKSELIQLLAERAEVSEQCIEANQYLQLLLDTAAVVVPLKLSRPEIVEWPAYGELLDSAKSHRTDLIISQSRVQQEQINYRLQKSMAVPDLTVGLAYDQQGNYIRNLYSIRTAIDIPLFNRNQGQIRAARSQVKNAELKQSITESAIEKEVWAALEKAKKNEAEYQLSLKTFNTDFPEVNRSVIENFNKGNISILDFMDFFQNYNSAIRQLNLLHKQRRLSVEELQYVVGQSLSFND